MTHTRIIDTNAVRDREDELIARVDRMALAERRSRANMLRVLIEEALEAREKRAEQEKAS